MSNPVQYPSPANLPAGPSPCNGIGPARGTSLASIVFWTLAWLPLGFAWLVGLQQAFKRAGDVHDLLYYMGGRWRQKWQADGVFLAELLDSVSHWGPLWIPFGVACAFFYCFLVVVCGWGSFRFRDQPLLFSEVVPQLILEGA